MSLNGFRHVCICKQKFMWLEDIKIQIPQEKLREFVNNHKDIFLWMEETTLGHNTINTIDTFIDKEGILNMLNQHSAYAFYRKDKKSYSLVVCWNKDYGHIMINFMGLRVNIPALEILLEMADYCEAMLLVNGKKVITKEFIEKEKLEIEAKKMSKKNIKGK